MKDDEKSRMQLIEELNELRGKVENKTKGDQEKYRLIAENTSDLIAVTTFELNPRYTYVSPSHRELGYTPEEMIGKPGLDYIHPEDRKRLLPLLRKYIKGKVREIFTGKEQKIVEKIRCRVRDGAGSWHFLESTVNLVDNELLIVSKDMTRQKQAEDRLERLNRTLLDLGPDADKNIDMITETCGELFGATCALYNRLEGNLLYTMGRWRTPDDYNPVDSADGHICCEVIRRGPEGGIYIVKDLEETSYFKSDPNVAKYGLKSYIGHSVLCFGKPVGSLCVVYQEDVEFHEGDIKLFGIFAKAIGIEEEGKKNEAKIKKNIERYRTLVEDMPALVCRFSPDGALSFVNRSYCSFFGTTSDALVGENFFKFIPEEDRMNVRKHYKSLTREKPMITYEHKVLTPDGEARWQQWTDRALFDGHGGLTEYQSIGFDTTDRKRAEEALRESEEKLAAMFNAIPDQVITLDRELNVVWANRSAREAFGSDLTGEKCLSICGQGDGPGPLCESCIARRCFEDGRSHEHEMLLATLKDGDKYFWATVDVVASHEDGRPRMVVKVFRDITEKKALEAETMRAGHLASIGELAAGVAHEINNPINSVINLAQILLNETEAESPEYDIARRIVHEGDRIASIVRGLLSFARERKETKSPVHVKDILSDTLALTEAQMRKDHIAIKMKITDPLPPLYANVQEIQQVFLNIMNNARYALNQKYSGPNEDKILEISIRSAIVDGRPHIRIAFLDKGEGIPSNVINKIMDPFFSTKPKGEGTGLGLSISHGIVNDHGGKLLLESTEGEYTRIIIHLPVKEEK